MFKWLHTALGVYGLELIERDIEVIESEGALLDDRGIQKVSASVCGPAMLLLLKAWALHERIKEKDGYDVVWLMKALGPETLASRFINAGLPRHDAGVKALQFLAEAFESIDHTGTVGWITTAGYVGTDADLQKREAVGIVKRFCRLCDEHLH